MIQKTVLMMTCVAAFSVAAMADSLFTKAAAEQGTLVANRKPKFEVGDIITVLVREKIDASTRSNTNTKKESEVTAEADPNDNEFLVAPKPDGFDLVNPERLPNWSIEADNEHKGTGSTRRSNTLVMTVACYVTNVHANGNVDIQGEKTVQVNREDSRILVSGTVRSSDVTETNSVDSNLMANAVIQLSGRGPLWNNERRGLVTKFLDWVSPF